MVMGDPLESPRWEGEFPAIAETVVVATGWGWLRSARLDDGRTRVAGGEAIGEIVQGSRTLPVTAPAGGVFLAWLADEGQWVAPGRPVARLRLN